MINFINNTLLKLLVFIIFLIFFVSQLTLVNANTVKIIKKINNEIITNFDIKKEYSYLIALNNNLKDLALKEAYKIAEESLVREKIKYSELKKFIDFEKIDKKLVEPVLQNIINKLKLKDKSEFKDYLNTYNLSIYEVEQRVLIEVLWNQMVASKYKDKININEKELMNKIKKENLLNKKQTEYDLSEIVFQASNQNEYLSKTEEIKKNITTIGFQNTANKFSISDTAKLGGSVGKINENQLSEIIREALKMIEVNEFTTPINVGSGFMILFINQKNIIEKQIDEKIMLEKMIAFEKNKQFENFSQIYFNKVRINTLKDEF
ncbi:peptidylprolyl isomerase [Candidatus Pelagibacter sp.]|nr:peptidylprolyl isomerase [Candidatus Pelagibacter sp.]